MSMMRQLTQTRTEGVGQREEESGGTGKGGADNYSGGAGRVSPTADTEWCYSSRSYSSRVGPRPRWHQNQKGLLTTQAEDQCFQLEWAR